MIGFDASNTHLLSTFHCWAFCSVSQWLDQTQSITYLLFVTPPQEVQIRDKGVHFKAVHDADRKTGGSAHIPSEGRGYPVLYDHPKASITAMMKKTFQRLPFGISSACKCSKKMNNEKSGIEGVRCRMDNILVIERDQPEHDQWLKPGCNDLVQNIDTEGVRRDLSKVIAITDLVEPRKIECLRRSLGLVNHFMTYFSESGGEDQNKPWKDLQKQENAQLGHGPVRCKQFWTWCSRVMLCISSLIVRWRRWLILGNFWPRRSGDIPKLKKRCWLSHGYLNTG